MCQFKVEGTGITDNASITDCITFEINDKTNKLFFLFITNFSKYQIVLNYYQKSKISKIEEYFYFSKGNDN